MSGRGRDSDEFQAYGEYSYAYLQKEMEERGRAEPAPASPPPASPKERPPRKRKRASGFLKLLALLTALTILLIVAQELVFRLDAVYILGDYDKDPRQIVMLSGLKRGRNIFTIDREEVARAMAQDHTLIFEGMQIEYPGTVYLFVRQRYPVAVMRWLGNQYELDEAGMVMTETSDMSLPEDMPLITGFRVTNVHEGQMLSVRASKQMEAYQAILSELTLQMYRDQVTEINLSDPSNIYLITAEGISVRLGDFSYMQAKIGAVRTDVAYLRQLGKTSGVLDVSIPEDGKFMPED